MSKSPTLNATVRTKLGTRYSARLRKEGLVPAVVYGHKEAPTHVTVKGLELTDALKSDAHLFTLALSGASSPCLVKDVQWDTFGRSIIHVDLARVSLDEIITVKVDVVLVGECAALKNVGTSILRPTATVLVSCKAKDIPGSVALDISNLAVGHSLSAENLTLPAGVTAVAPKTVLATINVGKDEEVAAPAEGAAAATPEVIKKGKEEEGKEGAAGAKPAAGGKAAPAAAAKPAAKK